MPSESSASGSKDRARIAIIGAGWWAVHNHIPAALKTGHADLAAVCRIGAKELAEVQRAFGFEYASEDLDALLRNVALDGAIICSPHGLHFEHASKALDAGLHVMVEKPMTTNSTDARRLVARAAAAGKEILVPHGWNFRPYTSRARALVLGGAIGRIRHVALSMASPAETLFSGQPYPGTESDMFRPPASTWADPVNFGGYGWGQLPHILGCLFRITDLTPAAASAISGASATGADIYNAATIRFVDGATGSLSGAGTVPMNSRFQVDIRLFGTEGMLLLDLEQERLVLRRNDDRNEDVEIEPGTGNYECVEPVNRFIDICRGVPSTNDAPGIVGMKSIEVIDAMYRSIASGRTEYV